MGPAAAVCEHFPFIQAEHHSHEKRKPANTNPLIFTVNPKYPSGQPQAYNPQDTLQGNGEPKQPNIDNPAQVVDGNPGEHIRDKESARVIHIGKIAVNQTDVIRIHHVTGGIFNIPKAEANAKKGQKPIYDFSVPGCVHGSSFSNRYTLLRQNKPYIAVICTIPAGHPYLAVICTIAARRSLPRCSWALCI